MNKKNSFRFIHSLLVVVMIIASVQSARAANVTQEQIDYCKKSIVTVYEKGFAVGCGIIVGVNEKRMYVATAYHVFKEKKIEDMKIGIFQYPGEKYGVSVIFHDEEIDLCILLLKGLKGKEVTINKKYLRILPGSARATESSALYPIGSPNGKPWTTPALGEPDHLITIGGDTFKFQTKIVEDGFSGGGVFASIPKLQNLVLIGMTIENESPEVKAISIEKILSFCRSKHIPIALTPGAPIPYGEHFSISINGMEYTKDNYHINLGPQPFDKPLKFEFKLKNISPFTQSISIVPSASVHGVKFPGGNNRHVFHPGSESAVFFDLARVHNGSNRIDFYVKWKEYNTFMISFKYRGLQLEREIYRRSGLRPSGNKKNYSQLYTLCLGSAPEYYTLISNSPRFWLTGDRRCGNWSHCNWVEKSNNNVCMAFSLQGHDEGRPYIRHSEGHLTAKYRLKNFTNYSIE